MTISIENAQRIYVKAMRIDLISYTNGSLLFCVRRSVLQKCLFVLLFVKMKQFVLYERIYEAQPMRLYKLHRSLGWFANKYSFLLCVMVKYIRLIYAQEQRQRFKQISYWLGYIMEKPPRFSIGWLLIASSADTKLPIYRQFA